VIGPAMTELLIVRALSQTSLSSVHLNPDDVMAEVGQFKYISNAFSFRVSVTLNSGILKV
jgi:hypothetical protein